MNEGVKLHFHWLVFYILSSLHSALPKMKLMELISALIVSKVAA